MGDNFSDCSWFSSRLSSSTAIADPKVLPEEDGSRFLVDNHRDRFLERYFLPGFLIDAGGVPGNDVCLLRHSNGVFVIGLASGHHLFHECRPGDEEPPTDASQPKQTHTILYVTFQVTDSLNRLRNNVRGRRKRGAQCLSGSGVTSGMLGSSGGRGGGGGGGKRPMDTVGVAVCNRGRRHALHCGLAGSLLEVNQRLVSGAVGGDCDGAAVPATGDGGKEDGLADQAMETSQPSSHVSPPLGLTPLDVAISRNSDSLSSDAGGGEGVGGSGGDGRGGSDAKRPQLSFSYLCIVQPHRELPALLADYFLRGDTGSTTASCALPSSLPTAESYTKKGRGPDRREGAGGPTGGEAVGVQLMNWSDYVRR